MQRTTSLSISLSLSLSPPLYLSHSGIDLMLQQNLANFIIAILNGTFFEISRKKSEERIFRNL